MSDKNQIILGRRSHQEFMAENLAGKFRSKADFYFYLDKHLQVSELIQISNISLVLYANDIVD